MKKIYFRILAICLSLFLTFSILYKDYIQAEALEWVGVAVGYDTAFKFLLGLLGVTVGVGVAEEVDWGQLRQDCTQVMIDQGASQVEASQWWADVIHGSLDTASSCWDSFKSWLSSYISSDSNTDIYSENLSDFVSSLGYSLAPGVSDVNINSSLFWYGFKGSTLYIYFYNDVSLSDFTFSVNSVNQSIMYVRKKSMNFYQYSGNKTNGVSGSFSSASSNGGGPLVVGGYLDTAYPIYVYNLSSLNLSGYSSIYNDFSTPVNDSPLEALYPNIGDIALNPENADTLGVDVIPLPWENIGVSEDAIQDIIDDAIERVIDGTMSLENYWEYIQNITNTYAYSIENNYLLPNENGEDKKADDKVKENTENGAFVLYGLEKVFPFCIPFDIYAFITLLKADPVAPVIEYPIYNPVTGNNEIITIDFSEWESVVIIFRYIFDFLLIIGLLLLARPLVGAGGDS